MSAPQAVFLYAEQAVLVLLWLLLLGRVWVTMRSKSKRRRQQRARAYEVRKVRAEAHRVRREKREQSRRSRIEQSCSVDKEGSNVVQQSPLIKRVRSSQVAPAASLVSSTAMQREQQQSQQQQTRQRYEQERQEEDDDDAQGRQDSPHQQHEHSSSTGRMAFASSPDVSVTSLMSLQRNLAGARDRSDSDPEAGGSGVRRHSPYQPARIDVRSHNNHQTLKVSMAGSKNGDVVTRHRRLSYQAPSSWYAMMNKGVVTLTPVLEKHTRQPAPSVDIDIVEGRVVVTPSQHSVVEERKEERKNEAERNEERKEERKNEAERNEEQKEERKNEAERKKERKEQQQQRAGEAEHKKPVVSRPPLQHHQLVKLRSQQTIHERRIQRSEQRRQRARERWERKQRRQREVWRMRPYQSSKMWRSVFQHSASVSLLTKYALWLDAQTVPFFVVLLSCGVGVVSLVRQIDPYGWYGIYPSPSVLVFMDACVAIGVFSIAIFNMYKMSTVVYAAHMQRAPIQLARLVVVLQIAMCAAFIAPCVIMALDDRRLFRGVYHFCISFVCVTLSVAHVAIMVGAQRVIRDATMSSYVPSFSRIVVSARRVAMLFAFTVFVAGCIGLLQVLDGSTPLTFPQSTPDRLNLVEAHGPIIMHLVATTGILYGFLDGDDQRFNLGGGTSDSSSNKAGGARDISREVRAS
eukprot:TRINITY_DN66132_c3_g1_i1.p1 TRINITY_DN66132_c3_g1~~TRINITY_DN66132_c3_g1_i1.p1  ORF type:complete len:689 (+),score=287.23 TRINITY_DN66132_c3_g1_i1:46-2112(+)